ncbi:MAG: hypothetical protein ABSB74_10620 [Tepidisphaeraceae bacterium]
MVSGEDFTLLVGNLGMQANGPGVAFPADNSTTLGAAVPASTLLQTANGVSASPIAHRHPITSPKLHSRKHR